MESAKKMVDCPECEKKAELDGNSERTDDGQGYAWADTYCLRMRI